MSDFKDLGGGVKRRILSHDKNIMMVEVHFEMGSVGTPHSHPHTQCTYVIRGSFEFTVDGRKTTVSKGDTLLFEPGSVHGTVCLEQGVLLDVFTPQRDDFL